MADPDFKMRHICEIATVIAASETDPDDWIKGNGDSLEVAVPIPKKAVMVLDSILTGLDNEGMLPKPIPDALTEVFLRTLVRGIQGFMHDGKQTLNVLMKHMEGVPLEEKEDE